MAAAANRDVRGRRGMRRRTDLPRFAARQHIPLIVPHNRDPNSAAFLDYLDRDLCPDAALSVFCMTIFRRPLLDRFDQAVNFHNGLLPEYKGLGATSFSMYAGEPETGFTFHRMTEDVDAGPILVQDAIAIEPTTRSAA